MNAADGAQLEMRGSSAASVVPRYCAAKARNCVTSLSYAADVCAEALRLSRR